MFVFLVTAALLLALRAYEPPTPLRVAALGLVLGLAVLARAEAGVLGAPPARRPAAGRAPTAVRAAPTGRARRRSASC